MTQASEAQNAQGGELDLFLEMLSAERGAAANTLAAYRRDLEEFLLHLRARRATCRTATADHIRAYLEAAARRGLAASSRARKLSARNTFIHSSDSEALKNCDIISNCIFRELCFSL